MYNHTQQQAAPYGKPTRTIQRIRWWYAALVLVAVIFTLRLFYLQVIRHDYYQKAAFKIQLKQYQIPATRGIINAHSGDTIVPLVLNETLYTLYADPTFVTDVPATAQKIQGVLGGDTASYATKLSTKDVRYVVLAKKLNGSQRDALRNLHMPGVGVLDTPYRSYPDGQLASQLLGFVNDDGQGTYGIEEALNVALGGTPGQLKAITDAQGVPLPANKDNTITEPVAGQNITLTVDLGLQQQIEDILHDQVASTASKSGSVVVMDVTTGAIKAMANYPSYDPGNYSAVKDPALFNNSAVTEPLEVGSIMKALTAAAALDQGVVNTNTTYYDPSRFTVDGWTITNVEEDGGAGTKSVKDILQLSLNTGATWLLMQMGGGSINEKARNAWHSYLVDHYRLGQVTGIEQGYESPGLIPDPNNGYGRNLTYANTAFGQAMLATPLQMVAAFGSVVNGGTYYRPHLVESTTGADGKAVLTQPKVERTQVVSSQVASEMRGYLEYTLKTNAVVYGAAGLPFDSYHMGGKTGTAQISKPTGGYYDDRFNGTYLGYVGGNKPQYAIAVRMTEPTHITGYAGAKAAAPVFAKVAQALINSSDVTPNE